MTRGPTIQNRRRAGPSPSLRRLWEPELKPAEAERLRELDALIAETQAALEEYHAKARAALIELRKQRQSLQNKGVCRARYKLIRGAKVGDFGSRREMMQESARRWREHIKRELSKDV